jgi:serine/threonine protein kinase
MATYDPTETIRIKVIKPEIGDYREIDVMPNELDVVKNAFIQQGYQVGETASEKTSTLGAFGGGILQGASLNFEEEIYGVLGGDEVQKEAEKQRKREERERPVARMAGEVVGSIIGAPAKVAGMTAKAASKLGPMAARGLGALTGAAEGAVSGIASKPMGEKDKLSAGDIATTVLGGLLGIGSRNRVYKATDKQGQEFAAKVGDFKNTLGKTESLVEGIKQYESILKEAKIVEDINKLKKSKLLTNDTLDTLPDMIFVHDPQKKVAYLKSKILQPLAKKEEEFLRTMPQNIEPNTDLDSVLNKIPNTPEYKRIKDYVLSLKELQEVSNSLGSLKPDNIMVDPQLNKLVIIDIGDIDLKPIKEIEKILQRPSALEALEEFELPGAPTTQTPKPLSSFAKMKGIEGEERILPAPEEKTAYGLLEKLGYRPIVGEKENVKLNDALQVISENNTIITSQIPRGRGAFGGVFEVAPKSAGDVIKPEDIKVAKLFREPNKKAVRKEIEVRKAIENIRKDEETPQIVKDSFVKSEAVEIDGVPIVIQEKLEKLPNNIRKQIDGSFWSQHKFYLRDKEKYPEAIDRKMKKLSPEVKQLLESLEYARLYHGLEWNDIKSANVMWDPKKKIPVIVDSGNFRQKIKPRSLGAAAAISPQQIEDATQVALAHFEQVRKKQPKTFGKMQMPGIKKQLENLGIIGGLGKKQEITSEELNVIKKVFPELGLEPVLQKGKVFDPYTDLSKPAMTSRVGGGITADVYSAAVPRSSVVSPEQAQKAAEDLATIKPEDFTNLIKLAEAKTQAPKEGLMLDTEQYVVKIPHPSRGRSMADIREYQENEIGIRQALEEARKTGTVSAETMEHFVPTRLIDFQNPIDNDYYTAYVMPKLEPIPQDLYMEIMREFPTSFDPPMRNAYKLEPYHISKLSKQAQDLFKALEDIRDKIGVYWVDLHGGNVLLDPKTNKLVVIDPGHFMHFPTGSPPRIITKEL